MRALAEPGGDVRRARQLSLMAADGIDILVDLSGHTGANRLDLFARKAAPVQLSWLGFWGTTGLPTIDYILSDATTIPEGDESHLQRNRIPPAGQPVLLRPAALRASAGRGTAMP